MPSAPFCHLTIASGEWRRCVGSECSAWEIYSTKGLGRCALVQDTFPRRDPAADTGERDNTARRAEGICRNCYGENGFECEANSCTASPFLPWEGDDR